MTEFASIASELEGAVRLVGQALLLVALGLLLVGLLAALLGKAMRRVLSRWTGLHRSEAMRRFIQPGICIRQPFDDSAMTLRVGGAIASLAQSRVGGGREAGLHLFLVTGEQATDSSLEALQSVPQTRTLAIALEILRRAWGRPRILVSGTLLPVGSGGHATLSLSLHRNSKNVAAGDFWPAEPPTERLTTADSYRVLAVTAAAWIEHHIVELSPGPRASAVFRSTDARSWALFRAGAELQRMSHLEAADDAYEQALALDGENVGALVDLANLRRREGSFDGAAALANRAVTVIGQAPGDVERATRLNPDWYRAQMVLATTYATWEDTAQVPPPSDAIEKASARAQQIASMALATTTKLDHLTESSDRQNRRELAKLVKVLGGADVLMQLRRVLVTTLEPGALLLIASLSDFDPGAVSGDITATLKAFADPTSLHCLRGDVLERLRPDCEKPAQPAPLVAYVKLLPIVSPRVEYNLACFHGRIARDLRQASRPRRLANTRARRLALANEELNTSMEYLRRSICRLPALERDGLFQYAQLDPDLRLLREMRAQELKDLERFVPRPSSA